jgi:hypothetical protein
MSRKENHMSIKGVKAMFDDSYYGKHLDKLDMTDPREAWRLVFSNEAQDLLQIQRCFAGEEVFQNLLRECLKCRKGIRTINVTTVENVLGGHKRRCEEAAYQVAYAAVKTGMHPNELIAYADEVNATKESQGE